MPDRGTQKPKEQYWWNPLTERGFKRYLFASLLIAALLHYLFFLLFRVQTPKSPSAAPDLDFSHVAYKQLPALKPAVDPALFLQGFQDNPQYGYVYSVDENSSRMPDFKEAALPETDKVLWNDPYPVGTETEKSSLPDTSRDVEVGKLAFPLLHVPSSVMEKASAQPVPLPLWRDKYGTFFIKGKALPDFPVAAFAANGVTLLKLKARSSKDSMPDYDVLIMKSCGDSTLDNYAKSTLERALLLPGVKTRFQKKDNSFFSVYWGKTNAASDWDSLIDNGRLKSWDREIKK